MFSDLIWVKQKSLPRIFCKKAIDKFEINPLRSEGKVDQNNPRVDPSLKVTMDAGITNNPDWVEEDNFLYEKLQIALDEYQAYLEDVCNKYTEGDGWKLHPNHNYEIKDTGYKIQKYDPNGYYHWHHDWCMVEGWSRIFTYIWYLNTVKKENGGWTEFIDGTKVQPKCGNIVFFPATWNYVHRGYTSKVPKYIITGWIYAKP